MITIFQVHLICFELSGSLFHFILKPPCLAFEILRINAKRHLECSIYYDPVMNPFDIAPHGMPYPYKKIFLIRCGFKSEILTSQKIPRTSILEDDKIGALSSNHLLENIRGITYQIICLSSP